MLIKPREINFKIEDSELLIKELYIDSRKKLQKWSNITNQSPQPRMGYIGQYLVSIVTGFPGCKSAARGHDLLLPDHDFAEVKTCYRIDQLNGKNDSKWLISVRKNQLNNVLQPKYYYLVLFEKKSGDIKISIWQVETNTPGFTKCIIDYYENIKSKQKISAPFNLWPFYLKFYLMRPLLIYESYIKEDDIITTIFPNRDTPIVYSKIPNNINKVKTFSKLYRLYKDSKISYNNFIDKMANDFYGNFNIRIKNENPIKIFWR